ncbi:MAG: MotA/TolQ/ExbB proton channel family protein [Candidatus Cloacimonetes bacterium]|nr:MotA/TolQ/ExbB proton channel family protein [Candidatus Cloacimonadota bacterium]
MSILSLMMQGGILMYVLLLLSIAVLAIVIEKYRQLAIVKKANSPVLEILNLKLNSTALLEKLNEGHAASPIAQVLMKVLAHDTKDKELITQSLESAANYELHKLEKGMGWLSTFSAIAPLIGFLGTVLGMVRVFMNIQHQSSAGIDINILAGGIWEAMLTTIGGLIVGIIAIVFYNDIITRLENILHDMQDSASQFLVQYYKES